MAWDKLSDYRIVDFLWLCAGAYTLYFVGYALYFLHLHPLSRFPGPKLWAISRVPWAVSNIKGDLYQTLGKLHEQYGPIVRIAPDELTTISPNAWKDIYVSKPLLLKDPYSQTPPLNGAHSLFTAEGATHRRIRAALANSFSDKALRGQANIIENYVAQLVTRIRREAGDTQNPREIDLTKLYGYTAFDTITDLSLGESLARGLEGDNEHGWVKNYFFHASFSAVRIALARFSPLDIFLGLFLLSMTRKARQRNWKVITGALNRRLAKMGLEKSVEEREKQRYDLITPLVDRLDESGEKGLTRAELLTNGLAFVIAGSQLNTNIMATATYLLLRHRETWDCLVREVRGRFADPSEITVQGTTDMVYMDAVINETLRIRHPTPINLPRVVPPEGYVVDGIAIPGNSVIGINVQNIQNDPSLWVEPRVFHPERFLPASDPRYDSKFDRDVKEAFAPFSIGPRNCIGYKLFFAQVRVALATVAWNFDLQWQEPAQEESWLDQRAWFAFEPRPLWVKPVERR
ncbi:cytochrome P450 [Talaromyces proteolyticus]|uniref:Cytochrome P450 n=1 Tax=Talaromyces proteolyticus TaxID=1131652 RepID=A0AAD4Q042_9EURO|nr:cytochrome P450 [Talaromyces proteolyticus]KAH8697262.1 cytochrome P450 [Talaromyces proteolyticus]